MEGRRLPAGRKGGERGGLCLPHLPQDSPLGGRSDHPPLLRQADGAYGLMRSADSPPDTDGSEPTEAQMSMNLKAGSLGSRLFPIQSAQGRNKPFLPCAVCQKPRRVCRLRRQIESERFLPGRVPGRKHFSGCKCGICPPQGDKLCAQQTVKVCRKSPEGFFDSLNKAGTNRSCLVFVFIH